jgi:hypothetical protein
MRVATFGDDLAVASSSLFINLLDEMDTQFALTESSLSSVSRLIEILNAIQENAKTFLAQVTFGTTVIQDTAVLNDLNAGGADNVEVAFAFQNRDDPEFRGADLSANNLKTIVFPTTSNQREVQALVTAFQQDSDSFRFTNRALNSPEDLRAALVLQSKELVASIEARKLLIQRPTSSSSSITRALQNVGADLADLRTAYASFLDPPTSSARVTGTKTTESPGTILGRAIDFLATLRVADQINTFPGEVDENLEEILGALESIAVSQQSYLSVYRHGEVRDFLAEIVSVSSVTNFLLADGEPNSSKIVQEAPALIEGLRAAVQSVILNDPTTENLYSSISLQVGALIDVLRGDKTDDPVGRLFELPVIILDSILPSSENPSAFSLDLEEDQEEVLRQLRSSFAVMRQFRTAVVRDLNAYAANLNSSFTDAEFFNAKLAGDSVTGLVSALKQA